MSLLLVTTTVALADPSAGAPYETPSAYAEVATDVPAHISSPAGVGVQTGGDPLEAVEAVLLCPLATPVRIRQRVTDLQTGDLWRVFWTRTRRGLGMDHTVAGLNRFRGGGDDGL